MATFKNILVPTDYDPAARRAADIAVELATRFRGGLTLLHVWDPAFPAYAEGIAVPLDDIEVAARKALDAEAARVRAHFPEAKTLLIPGLAWRTIEETAREQGFDLIVIGTHGRRGLPRMLLGSVAEKVVRTATVPVLTVHADDEPVR
jgi:nucleotide-binding universal stress UspA family protein